MRPDADRADQPSLAPFRAPTTSRNAAKHSSQPRPHKPSRKPVPLRESASLTCDVAAPGKTPFRKTCPVSCPVRGPYTGHHSHG